MSKENKIQEQYFYKRQVKIWKQDLNAIVELGYKGYAIQGLAMDLIIEYQHQLTLDTLVKQTRILGLTEQDITEALDIYEDFYYTDEGFIRNRELDLVLAKDEYFTNSRSIGGYKTTISKKLSKGEKFPEICKHYKVDVNELINLNTTEEKIENIINQIITNKNK